MKNFEQEIKNIEPLTYYEIIINDGDYEECESDVCFSKEADAVSYLKKKADVIFKDCEEFNKFDFAKVDMDEVNIYIDNDGYFGKSLHAKIKTEELICEEDREYILFNNETLFIRKQRKFFIEK